MTALLIWLALSPQSATADDTNQLYSTPIEDEAMIAPPGMATTSIQYVPPTPKELIQQAFPDAPVMVRIAAAESSFVPTAKNPNSTASGLFQILHGTWKAYGCTGDEFTPADNIACARKMYDQSSTSPWLASASKWQ